MRIHFQKVLPILLTLFFLFGVCGSHAAASEVDVNTADVKALVKLPGIGKVTAERIVAERTENGHFRDMKDLQKRVNGIGNKTASRLEGKVTFSKTTNKSPEKTTRTKEDAAGKEGKEERPGKEMDAARKKGGADKGQKDR